MAQYRVPTLDLSTRIQLAVEMRRPVPERGWGRVTQLAEEYGVSRTWLYNLRNKAQALLRSAVQPQKPGPKSVEPTLQIEREFLQRAIPLLPLLTGRVRDVKIGLKLLFEVSRSIGYSSETLQEAGQRAEAHNPRQALPLPVLGEADESFQGRRPCLTVVDGRSFLVLTLTPAVARDETHWGVPFLELLEQGVTFHDVGADRAKGIAAGLVAPETAIPLRPDLFPLLRQAHPLTRRLERLASQAIKVADRAPRAVPAATAPPPLGQTA